MTVVRYVSIEETVILIMCSVFVNHMKRIRNTNDRLVDVIVFYPNKYTKLQLVPPSMPLEALLITDNLTNSDSDGIDGGTGCNFIFFIYIFYFHIHGKGCSLRCTLHYLQRSISQTIMLEDIPNPNTKIYTS